MYENPAILSAMNDKNLHIVDHPIVQALLTGMRDKSTPPDRFRQLVRAISHLLGYEATRKLRMEKVDIDTPLETLQGVKLGKPITIVPILRAGLGMADGLTAVIPAAQVGHLGMFRDEEKLKPVSYYENLPTNIAEGSVLVADPMLATGGSAKAAIQLLRDRGVKELSFLCILCAPEGIAALRQAEPDMPIYTAAIDRQLNDIGFILPGLGDAGDRQFGTL